MRTCLWIALAGIAVSACEDRGVDVQSHALADYSIDQLVLCFCPGRGDQVRVFVRSDTIADVLSLAEDTLLSRDYWGRFRTIDELFEEIAKHDTSLWVVEVTMDLTDRFPARLHVRHKQIADMGMTWVTSNLVELQHL